MSIYKYVSIKEVIAKVYRDLNIKDPSRWADMIEWCAEALEAIQAPEQTVTQIEKLCIHDYKVAIPCALSKLNYIYYNGYPLLPSTSVMGNTLLKTNINRTSPDPITLEKLNGNPALLEVDNFVRPENKDTYTLDPAYIRTTFRTGDIYISYEAIPLDDEGYPIIPDDISYKTALFWYCAKMLLLPDWYEGKNTRYEEAEYKWQTYCGQAGAKAMMPDLPRMENIKNIWVRLLPTINAGNTFFNGLGTQERINL